MTAPDRRAVRVRVTGRVQGVGFRAWTRDRAQALGCDGWVRNEPDGSVTALVCGIPSAIDEMVAALHDGPPWSNVTGVEIDPVQAAAIAPGFRVDH